MLKLLSNLTIEKVYLTATMYGEAGVGKKRTNRERWCLLLKYEGETLYKCRGKTLTSDIGHVMILPRGSSYEWRCVAAGHYTCVEFDCKTSYPDIFSFPISSGEELLKMLKKLEYGVPQAPELAHIQSIRDVYSILLKLARELEGQYVPGKKAKRLLPIAEYMQAHCTERMTNDSLAAMAGMSTVYFRKLFREVYGQAPMEYLKDLKIKKARRMLQGDYGSIADIAMQLGYSNIYDFSRDFKKHTGVAPSKYSPHETP